MATVNTRLVLRNDELSNWNASSRELLKGEAALAWLSGDLYEIRVGTGGKTWSQLGGCNIRIPAANVRDLAYAEYQLSSLETQEGEASRFQLCGRDPATLEWTAIGDPLTIPEVDVSEIEGKIGELSGTTIPGITGDIDALSNTTIPGITSDISSLSDDLGALAERLDNLSVSQLVWDIDEIDCGDSGYVAP